MTQTHATMLSSGVVAVALALFTIHLNEAQAIRLPFLGPRNKDANVRPVFGGVVLQEGKWSFVSEVDDGVVAHGAFIDSYHTRSNFGKLRITTSSKFSDTEQLFAAGYLEGYITAERIYDNLHNVKAYFLSELTDNLDEPMKWLAAQDKWVRDQVSARSKDSQFWRTVGLMLLQFDGLVEGYSARSSAEKDSDRVPALTREDFIFLNGNGELYDIIDALNSGSGYAEKKRDAMSPNALLLNLATSGRCSALIKLAADLSEIYIGHATWDSYTAALKIFKHYEFNLKDEVASRRMSFSSYPGELFSDDDFYLLESGLVVLETTNKIFNMSVYDPLTPQSVLSWQRVRAANLLAHDGRQWVELFSTLNSGTYNNQYMVLDLHKFLPSKRLLPGLLYVVEQLPAIVRFEDVTPLLLEGHWPSYNVPYFEEIYNRSGYPEFIQSLRSKGHRYEDSIKWLDYQVTPRASIFRRDHAAVNDLAGMKHLMRFNDWDDDPLADGHPVAGVCGRGDLEVNDAIPKGCFDTKVTTASLALKLEAEAVNGPTNWNGLPSFSWKDWPDYPHRGHPDVFDFEFEHMTIKDLFAETQTDTAE